MIQVIEHLTPQHVVDFVRIAADKVRPGGRVMVETVNPESLYIYAHALWVDPDHVRPVHPGYLEFLFGKAGFTVEEVPIRFADRTEGGSKMGPAIVLEAVVRVPALRIAAARGRL